MMYLWWTLCTLHLLAGQVSYHRWLRSLLFVYVFWVLINSLMCWFCTSALGLILFQIVHAEWTWKAEISMGEFLDVDNTHKALFWSFQAQLSERFGFSTGRTLISSSMTVHLRSYGMKVHSIILQNIVGIMLYIKTFQSLYSNFYIKTSLLGFLIDIHTKACVRADGWDLWYLQASLQSCKSVHLETFFLQIRSFSDILSASICITCPCTAIIKKLMTAGRQEAHWSHRPNRLSGNNNAFF